MLTPADLTRIEAIREACAKAVCEFCRKGVPLIREDAHKCDCGHCAAMVESGGKPLGSRCAAAAIRALDLARLAPATPQGAATAEHSPDETAAREERTP